MIKKDKNWEIGKDRRFLSFPTHHFESTKLYIFLSPQLSGVTGNIYLFLSLCLVLSIFSYSSVYPPTEVASIFFYPLAYLSTTNFNLFQLFSLSFVTEDSYLFLSLSLSFSYKFESFYISFCIFRDR